MGEIDFTEIQQVVDDLLGTGLEFEGAAVFLGVSCGIPAGYLFKGASSAEADMDTYPYTGRRRCGARPFRGRVPEPGRLQDQFLYDLYAAVSAPAVLFWQHRGNCGGGHGQYGGFYDGAGARLFSGHDAFGPDHVGRGLL